MSEPLDARERRELCDLFMELGPDAPTLCEGWATLDLAAHLTLREHFHRWSGQRMTSEKAKGLPALVQRLRAGAPLFPWRLPRVRTLLNGAEYFIHHEDVRRANGLHRRDDRPDLEPMAWRMVGLSGRRVAGKLRPLGLELRRPDGAPRVYRRGSGDLVLAGEPTELLLYLSGRCDAADVDIQGPSDAAAALRKAVTGH